MRVDDVSLEEIRLYEKNPRNNDDAVDAVAESIRQYGFKVPIVLDSDGVIVAGHTRYKAAVQLGMDKVPCVVADDLTPEQARAFRIADNKTSDLSTWDNKMLLEELQDISEDGLFTGFEESQLFFNVGTYPLDEKDNDVLEYNEAGVRYIVRVDTMDKEKAEAIASYAEGLGCGRSL